MIRTDALFGLFVHTVASVVVVSLVLLFTLVTYFGMLVWAVLGGWPIGGMLAFPFLMLLALVTSVAASVFVFFPVTVAASALCRRRNWSRMAQIPIAAGLCLAEMLVATAIVAGFRGASVAPSLAVGLVVTSSLLAPLVAYWWVVQSADGLRTLTLAIWNHIR